MSHSDPPDFGDDWQLIEQWVGFPPSIPDTSSGGLASGSASASQPDATELVDRMVAASGTENDSSFGSVQAQDGDAQSRLRNGGGTSSLLPALPFGPPREMGVGEEYIVSYEHLPGYTSPLWDAPNAMPSDGPTHPNRWLQDQRPVTINDRDSRVRREIAAADSVLASPSPLLPPPSPAPPSLPRASADILLQPEALPPAFHVVTPTAISNAEVDGTNPYECFETHRSSGSGGRMGPRPPEERERTLLVRRLGACFCCRIRKVKCDMKRPCRNCMKLAAQIPQLVCWQFQDFLAVLFPDFIRDHFRPEKMEEFMRDHVDQLLVDGTEMPCEVTLSSGGMFKTTLNVSAKFFTPKAGKGLEHWLKKVDDDHAISLESQVTVPIAMDLGDDQHHQKKGGNALRKKLRHYIDSLIQEPLPAEKMSHPSPSAHMAQRIIWIVQRYANSAKPKHAMVKRALAVYTMHYVMSRHLCLTRQNIVTLGSSNRVPQNLPWVTSRVLSKQIKCALDALMLEETQQLFDLLARTLKDKSRLDWAPCVASFLILCLFMESVETATDGFVISWNEIARRDRTPMPYKRELALDACAEVENMPFKQCAFQIHQTFQTHSRNRGFNPIQDDVQLSGLDDPTVDLILALRTMVWDVRCRQEMDTLMEESMLGERTANEKHPFPRDVTYDYAGKLVTTFLLSFVDINYLYKGTY